MGKYGKCNIKGNQGEGDMLYKFHFTIDPPLCVVFIAFTAVVAY